ncbi:hypothetical protein BG011_000958 [Mortierella polycephala]|uniref:Uncharacterized protein n=1 Tax=Mortierella polycephala TaxID=41804 RepID=A0A9P6PHQ4_9FUNG|nr:hypothetical protein BG011_000958 [Mortierella polycephala]
MTGVYQSFRSGDRTVRIQTFSHPVTGEPFVIWSDIADCFPGVARIQNEDVFVPLLRDERLYRVRPHGIKYHPDVALDVIYDRTGKFRPRFQTHNGSLKSATTAEIVRIKTKDIPSNNTDGASNSSSKPSNSNTSNNNNDNNNNNNNNINNNNTNNSNNGGSSSSGSSVSGDGDLAVPVDTLKTVIHEALMPIYKELKKAGIPLEKILENTPYAGLYSSKEGPIPSASAKGKGKGKAKAPMTGIFGDEISPEAVAIVEKALSEEMPELIQESDNDRSHVEVISGCAPEQEQPLTAAEDPKAVEVEPSKDGDDEEQQDDQTQADMEDKETTVSDAESEEKAQPSEKQDIPTSPTNNISTKAESTAPTTSTPTAMATLTKVDGTQAVVKEEKRSPFSIHDIVAHRAKDILAQRYDWLESPCPKLFIMVPHKDDVSSVADIRTMTWQDFDLYFLCDCGEIPGADVDKLGYIQGSLNSNQRDSTKTTHTHQQSTPQRCLPHVDIDGLGYALQKDALAFGPYMMAILEMLEYGVAIDGVVKVPALSDLVARKKVMYAMAFLMMQGVEASHQVHAKGYASLDEIKPIVPLKEAELADLYRSWISARRPLEASFAYRTLAGDIRWICYYHWTLLSARDNIEKAIDFSLHPDSKQSAFHMNLGSLIIAVKTRERVQDFYRLAEQLTTVPVLSFFLDWDLSGKDESELQSRIYKFTASCVKIHVREREEEANEVIPGFGHGYFGVILAGLSNKMIQAFSIEKRVPGDATDTADELFAFKGSVYLDPVLARFTRELPSFKVQLGLLVTNLDRAANSIRAVLNGFHTLSKLTLEASYWDHVNIDFCVDGEGPDDLEDSQLTESEVDFFNRREHDAITVRTYLSADTNFLKTHALKDVNIRIAFQEDGPRIRELIKNNRRLKRLELSIDCKDDPCQVFEYFKALMHNHPSMDAFQLRKDWGKNNKSNFVWHGVSDRSKMTLAIQSYAEDKIGPLLQKFGTCLLQLFIHSINAQDSAILEKVTRSRKGQLKLIAITLVDAFSMSQPALDDLAKVVLRTSLQRFSITGTASPRATTRLADFMTMVAPKITDIHLFGEHGKAILTELAKRMPESSNMGLLIELKLSGPFDATTKDLAWLRSLLNKEIPLGTIELHKVNLSHQGWMTLAQEIDFMRLKYFRVGPDVPLKNEAIAAFVSAVPEKSGLENFHLDSEGLREGLCLAYKTMLIPKLRKKTALVSIGRYF